MLVRLDQWQDIPDSMQLSQEVGWLVLVSVFLKVQTMKNKFYSFLIATCVLLLLSFGDIFSQSYPFKSLTVENGLVGNKVFAVMQDRQGYLWFATNEGVNKYDGNRLVAYTKGDGLLGSGVPSMYQDREGNLWFGSHGYGVNRFDGTNWRAFSIEDGLSNNFVRAITEDASGNIWLGTEKGVSRFDGKQWEQISNECALEEQAVISITADRENNLWFGTFGGGVLKFDGEDWTQYTTDQGLVDNRVLSVCEDAQGNIWCGTLAKGASRFDGEQWIAFSRKDGLSGDKVRSIALARDSSLWFGTDRGVSRFDGSGWMTFSVENGLNDDEVMAVLEDREGNLWFGTNGGGVSQLKNTAIATYTQKDGLKGNLVLSIAEDSRGNLWLGTSNGGISRWDGQLWESYTVGNQPSPGVVFAILPDRQGSVWAGTNHGGGRFDGRNWSTFVYEDSLAGKRVHTIAADSSGNIWFGFLGGVFKFDGENFEKYTSGDGLVHDNVVSIIADDQGTLWFGTYGGGISRYNGEGWSDLTVDDGLASNFVNTLFFDKDGSLWVGTEDRGACRFDGKNFFALTREGGLPSNRCLSIARNGDCLYFGTDKGVCRYDGRTFITYTKDDGLGASIISRSASLRDSHGNLWFGTGAGATKLRPRLEKHIAIPPAILITNVSLLDKSFVLSEGVQLKHTDNDLRFDYTGIYFGAPDDLSFSYMLQGFDTSWQSSNLREAVYINLPSGKYTFKVRVRARGGAWSTSPAEYSFEVKSAFWTTWWFRILAVSLIAWIILTLTKYWYHGGITKQLRRKNLELQQALEKLNKEIAGRLQTQKELSASEEQFKSIFDSDLVGIFRNTLDGVPLEANEAMVKMFGYSSREEYLRVHKTREHYVYPEIRDRMIEILLREGELNSFQALMSRKDGSEFWMEFSAKLYPEKGYLEGVVIDVTDRKSAEEYTRHLSQVLMSIRNVNQLIVREKDRKKLIQTVCDSLIETRSFFSAWIAVTDEQGELKDFAEAGWGEEAVSLRDHLKLSGCLRQGVQQPDVLIVGEDNQETIGCLRLRQHEGCGAMVSRLDYEGTVYGLLAVSMPEDFLASDEELDLFKEVTEDIAFALHKIELDNKQVQMDLALRQSEKLFRTIISTSMDAMIAVDSNGLITIFNPAAEKMFDCRAEDMIGGSLDPLLPDEYKEKHGSYLKGFFTLGEPSGAIGRTIELTALRKDGTVFPIELTLSEGISGEQKFVVAVIRDITERKQSEARLKRQLEIEKVLAEISSEFVNIPVDQIDDAIDSALGRLGEFVGADRVSINQADLDACLDYCTNEWCARGIDTLKPAVQGIRLTMDEKGEPQLQGIGFVSTVGGMPDELDWLKDFLNKLGIKSFITIPLWAGDLFIGALNIDAISETKEWPQELLFPLSQLSDIFANIIARKKVVERVNYRIEIEELISSISTNFINIPSGEVDREINNALRMVGEFTGVDRNYVYFFTEDMAVSRNTHEWCAGGIESLIDESEYFEAEDFPFWARKMRNFEIVHIPRVQDLPEEAEKEKRFFQARGVKSILGVPLIYGQQMKGFIGLDSIREERKWVEEDITILKILGEIIVSAMQRGQAEEALIESEEKYRTLIEFAKDGVGIIREQKLLYANPSLVEMLGYPAEELVNTSFEKFIHPDERQNVVENHRKRLAGEQVSSIYESALLTADGRRLEAEFNVCEISLAGESVQMIFIKDITDRKRVEEEQTKAAKLESIGVLAGGIAHDFNNILTSILGNISLAHMHATQTSNNRDQLSDILVEAEKAAERAKGLTRQLLTFSKGGDPIKKVISLASPLKEAAGFTLRGSNVHCDYDIADDLWLVNADEGQISQVIQNLTINAVQAMPSGGKLGIKAENFLAVQNKFLPPGTNEYVRITFKDTGSGIPAGLLANIFDPYFTTKAEGSGLGLATSYSIVKRHGGYITVDSTPDVGTTFEVFLPASFEQQVTVIEESGENEIIDARVLIMDDEKPVLRVASRMIEMLGGEAEVSENGSDAVRLYSQAADEGRPFDLVILDLTVPGGAGGMETIKELMRIDPDVKAIVSSGYANDPVMADPEKYGFGSTVIKPFKVNDIKKAILAVLGDSEEA